MDRHLLESDGFFLYRTEGQEGATHLLSLLPPDAAFRAGVPAEAIVGECTPLVETLEHLTPSSFRPNPLFVNVLHYVVATHAPGLPGLRAQARQQRNGWVYLIDARTPRPQGEVPPHDIIGAFEVAEGTIVPHSYKANPNHLLLSPDGLFRLDPQLHERLVERVARQAPGDAPEA